MSDYSDNWWNKYIDITPLYTCADCKFANEYIPHWAYPYIDPCCSKGNACAPNKSACSSFQLIGRLSR